MYSDAMIEFGHRIEGIEYVNRACAYGIIANGHGEIAVVRTRKGYLLPGGGIEAGESFEAGLRREILEELGCESTIFEQFCAAAQFSHDPDDGIYYKKLGHFFRATLGEKIVRVIEPDHELFWFTPSECPARLAQEFQSWAIRQAFGIFG